MEPKKRYNVVLPPKAVGIIQEHLKKNGMTFSGFLSALLSEYANELEGNAGFYDKKLAEMTLEELGNFLKHWVDLSKVEK